MFMFRGGVAAVLSFLLLSGCDSNSTPAMSTQQPVGTSSEAMPFDDAIQCDAAAFDVARLLFTESDRQWFCLVNSATLSTEDELFFDRNGTATMARFRDVFWNRSLADQAINVASPFVSPFVLRNLSSSNTVLRFDRVTDTGNTEAYNCVLVAREVSAPEIL